MPGATSSLAGVYWSFAEPTPESVSGFIEAAEEYASSIDVASPRRELEREFGSNEVDLQFSYSALRTDGEWEDVSLTVHVRKRGGGALTNGELLFRLHETCSPLLRDQDHHFFEGLRQNGMSQEGVPIFQVVQGS